MVKFVAGLLVGLVAAIPLALLGSLVFMLQAAFSSDSKQPYNNVANNIVFYDAIIVIALYASTILYILLKERRLKFRVGFLISLLPCAAALMPKFLPNMGGLPG
jgi:cellobiose-specific phosphotransferase system component IIC